MQADHARELRQLDGGALASSTPGVQLKGRTMFCIGDGLVHALRPGYDNNWHQMMHFAERPPRL